MAFLPIKIPEIKMLSLLHNFFTNAEIYTVCLAWVTVPLVFAAFYLRFLSVIGDSQRELETVQSVGMAPSGEEAKDGVH